MWVEAVEGVGVGGVCVCEWVGGWGVGKKALANHAYIATQEKHSAPPHFPPTTPTNL